MNIAIDGPSGAGKSTIAKLLAQKLKIVYLDTGAMYRSVGVCAYRNNVDPNDVECVTNLLDKCNIDIMYKDGLQTIMLNGEDVTKDIRENLMSRYASSVAKIASVRKKLIARQREIASSTDSVLDGRDIGTVVLPNANYKFYLTADVNIRAERRHKELMDSGEQVSFDKIVQEVIDRDKHDMTRELSPLKKADDAIEIDSTQLSIDGVVDKIISYLK